MRRVLDVMTTEVICASRDTPYKQLVRLLLDRKVSAPGASSACRWTMRSAGWSASSPGPTC